MYNGGSQGEKGITKEIPYGEIPDGRIPAGDDMVNDDDTSSSSSEQSEKDDKIESPDAQPGPNAQPGGSVLRIVTGKGKDKDKDESVQPLIDPEFASEAQDKPLFRQRAAKKPKVPKNRPRVSSKFFAKGKRRTKQCVPASLQCCLWVNAMLLSLGWGAFGLMGELNSDKVYDDQLAKYEARQPDINSEDAKGFAQTDAFTRGFSLRSPFLMILTAWTVLTIWAYITAHHCGKIRGSFRSFPKLPPLEEVKVDFQRSSDPYAFRALHEELSQEMEPTQVLNMTSGDSLGQGREDDEHSVSSQHSM